jgi:tetratricopeptide (TPR) repeat protein
MPSENHLISKYYKKSDNDRSIHWLEKVNEFSEKIFSSGSGNNNSNINEYISLIKDPDCIFDKLIKTFSEAKRMSYCKAIFNYCEMSQDWRVVGIWLKEEIEQLEMKVINDNEEDEDEDEDEDEAWLCFAYGRYLEETGKFKQSFEFHEKGIKISEKYNDLLNLAFNKLGIGIALQRFTDTKDIQFAKDYLIQAVEFFKDNNHYQLANSLLNLGSCYDRLDEADKAIESYQKCIHILKELNNKFDLGRAYYSLGIAYLRNNQLLIAEKTFEEGEFYCKQGKNLYFLSLIYYGFGWLEYSKKKFSESTCFLEKSIRSFNKYKEDYFNVPDNSFYESEGNIYLLAGATYCKIVPISKQTINYYLDQAEIAYKQLEYCDKKLAQVLANRARLHEFLEEWEPAINSFYELFCKGRQMKQMNIMSDATIHLFRIYRKRKSSISACFMLASKLGFLGFQSLLLGYLRYLQRKRHTRKIA